MVLVDHAAPEPVGGHRMGRSRGHPSTNPNTNTKAEHDMTNPLTRVHEWLRVTGEWLRERRDVQMEGAWFVSDYEEPIEPTANPTDLAPSMFDATAELPKPNPKTAEVATQLRLDGTGEVDVIHVDPDPEENA